MKRGPFERVALYSATSIAKVVTNQPSHSWRIATVVLDFGPIALVHPFVTQ